MNTRVSQLQQLPVISLQTSETVAVTGEPVIEMATLDVLALYCISTRSSDKMLLLARDVRQLAPDCVIVDSEDELSEPDDIVRLQGVIKQAYNPLGKHVVTEHGHGLGNVEDYNINLDTSQVQQLFLRRPLLKPWQASGLIIDRSQIVDVTSKHITVRDGTIISSVLNVEPVPEIQH